MKLVTWNIQWGKGCDGKVDLARIVAAARNLADADIYCFQEVSSNFAELDGGADQPAILSDLLPGYEPVFRPAVELGAGTELQRFGAMILSRLPVLRVSNHLLPWPASQDGLLSMQRQALEVLIETRSGPLRVMTTHLEYHSASHRAAQVEALLTLAGEAETRDRAPSATAASGPYRSDFKAAGTLLCGDFNLAPDDGLHARLTEEREEFRFFDAWALARPGEPHAPTCGVGDREQWPQGPHCRDFVFVSDRLARQVRRIEVDTETLASDHQPVLVELGDQAT